jgi:outer membrane biosynthesis protein TonB
MGKRRAGEWQEGDRCLMRAGFYSRDGAATKLVPGKVIRLVGGDAAAEVRLDSGRECTVRLSQLTHDETWEDEKDAREREKAERLARESKVRLVPDETKQQPLTFSLGEKLKNLATQPEPEPVVVDDALRAEARAMIAAIAQPKPQHVPDVAPETLWSEPPPAPEPAPQPEPEPQPEPTPEPPPEPPAHPLARVLQRVQDRLVEAYSEQEELRAAIARLGDVDKRVTLLEAQERQARAAMKRAGLL